MLSTAGGASGNGHRRDNSSQEMQADRCWVQGQTQTVCEQSKASKALHNAWTTVSLQLQPPIQHLHSISEAAGPLNRAREAGRSRVGGGETLTLQGQPYW